jgi:capsular polysaccharide biosynthesis protein
MKDQKHIILSLTDIVRTLRREMLTLLLGAGLCGGLAFAFLALKSVHFTAKGVYNGHISQKEAPLLKALEFLGIEENAFSQDPRSLMKSYSVLEGVVKTLGLQATLTERQWGRRIKEIGYTLKSAWAYRTLKEAQPTSRILDPSISVPPSPIIPDEKVSLSCMHVDYISETPLALKIQFIDTQSFRVCGLKKTLGVGKLGTPFIWEGGAFTLTGKGKKGKKMALHLIPLEPAVASLKRNFCVVKDKENNALFELSYTHRDRQLASQIVNEVMEQFHRYMLEESKKKIKRQLLYLKQRQHEVLEQLDSLLQKQKAYLTSDIESGNIITLQRELDFYSQQQSNKREELLRTSSEMLSLGHVVFPGVFDSCDDMLEFLRASQEEAIPHALSIDSVRSLIAQHQQQLEAMRLDKEVYAFCLQKLAEPYFDCSSLCKILKEEFLHARFEKMHSLHHHLVDAKNWTEKERGQRREELETEKRYLVQHIHHLQEGAVLQENIFKERIAALQHNLLYLLFQSYEQASHALNDLNKQAAHFPQKWLNEQQIEIHTKLYSEMMEAISKMVEAKNIGYHLDYMMSSPLQKAFPPLLPNHPHLLRGFFLCGAGGFLLGVCVLLLYQAWVGPTASYENLTAINKQVFAKEDIPRFGMALAQSSRVIVLASKKESALVHHLSRWMGKRGEKILVLDVDRLALPEKFEESDRLAYLSSEQFKSFLESQKKLYARIFLVSQQAASSFIIGLLASLADRIVYGVTDEYLSDIKELPDNSLYYIQEARIEKRTLNSLQPILDKMLKNLSAKSFSFSSWKDVLKRFPLRKI